MNHPIQNLPTVLPTDRHYPRNRVVSAGFTIVELLIVIVVIGILATMTLVAYNGIQQQVRDKTILTDLHGLGFLESQYALLNNAPGKDWYSGNGIDSSLNFKPSSGNVIDVMTNGTDYCIRAYNPGSATYKTLATAATRESAPGACTVIVASATATTDSNSSTPGWSKMAVGFKHACGIANNGKAYCWGADDSCQLGNGNNCYMNMALSAVDTSGVLSGKTLVAISAGDSHTCVLDSNGKAYCWGYNGYGQLGNNSTTTPTVPVAVDTSGVLSGKTLVAISAGGWTTCVVSSDGKAYCWGNSAGQGKLGNNSPSDSSVPVAVDTSGVLSGKTLVAISAGANSKSSCAVDSAGAAYCWGSNTYGNLGNNNSGIGNSLTPVNVYSAGVLAGKSIVSIDAGGGGGGAFACAIDTTGASYCWGSNSNAQLGNNLAANSYAPVAVYTSGDLSGKTLAAISVGAYHTCVLDSNSKAYCWGSNGYGQLGNNSTTNSRVPVGIYGSSELASKVVVDISAGFAYSCAVTSESKAYCWGNRDYSTIYTNTLTPTAVPQPPTP